MNITINPFQQLYFSDDTQSEDNFVELFSDEVLQTAIHPVFQGGNVILSGTQGCGKTMILNLLRPETRMAYYNTGQEFPVSEKMRNYVSAGINLTRSRITDIVQVTLHRGEDADEQEMPFYFADFFNYLIVNDLLNSIKVIGNNPDIFASIVNIKSIPDFVYKVTKQDCWFGTLEDVTTIEELEERIANRIKFYRSWVNGNLAEPQPPNWIQESKTNIGEPIARTAASLRDSGVIKADVPVLIRVDQIEELHRAFTSRQRQLLLAFRKMINRVFASRDTRVHYRAGTRRYGWRSNHEFLSIWGSEARLEERRDYLLIDMDAELFSLGENKNSIFKKFTIDAFQKRIRYFFRDEGNNFKPNLARSIFGKHPFPEQRLVQLNQDPNDTQIDRALGLDLSIDEGDWTHEWRDFLRKIYRSGNAGMLNAALAAAWGRQTGGARLKKQHRELPPPNDAPWKTRKWWRKERLDQAVLQLVTRCQQRFMWWGFNDIHSLSGGNITVFLHICHRIWDGFLKSQSSLPLEKRTDLLNGGEISPNIQSSGILFASNEWFNKLPEEPGGNSRQNFVQALGSRLNRNMVEDLAMSYPGGNGISLPLTDYKSDAPNFTELRNFISEAVDYGVLFETEHASKSKPGGKRIKFYLHPILCPRFQLPEARTKEPYYWNIQETINLINKSDVNLSGKKISFNPDPQLPLKFDSEKK